MVLTPGALLTQLRKGPPLPVYLFLGPELYQRDECRRVLTESAVPAEERENGISTHDLEEAGLAAVLDDARSFSLFASRRLIWVSRAEAALPRGRAAASEEESSRTEGAAAELASYLQSPTPGVVLVFDSHRFDFEGEDKQKSERLRKFYSAVPGIVEFARLSVTQVRSLSESRAKELGLKIGGNELDLLVEATGASALAVRTEMEKLSAYCGSRPVTVDDIERLVPQARTTTIFALVNALGRRDRPQALDLLDLLVKEGEYLPLALGFLGTQFRQALVAREAGLKSGGQIQGYFSKMGVPMWPSRAEQIAGTLRTFTEGQLRRAVTLTASADSGLRDTRPDDRTILEEFVIALTK